MKIIITDIRIGFSFLFTIVALALGVCAFIAARSPREIGKTVAKVDLALIPPLMGNLIIIGSSVKNVAAAGYHIYFIGMNIAVLSMVEFTNMYCKISRERKHRTPKAVYGLLIADIIQLLLNPFFGHAFSLEGVDVQGKTYYKLIPHLGQYFHRVVDNLILGALALLFLIMVFRMSKVNRGRYRAIFVSMMLVALWQSFYFFSKTPVNRSMLGFGIFGLLVFYFSICFRPLKLLDRMLSDIAAEMVQALYVFDPNGKCVWMNIPGMKLADVKENELDDVPAKLEDLFGKIEFGEGRYKLEKIIDSNGERKYYLLEMRSFNDDSKRLSGSFLIIRDTTEEKMRIKQELYNSCHDSLTGLYTRQHLYEQIREKLDSTTGTDFITVFVDVKNFKIVNDIFSTAFGDRALQQIADWIRSIMTPDCVYGRLAGDTFGIFAPKDCFDVDKVDSELSSFTVADGSLEYHILIHVGIYEVTEKDTEISVMFDRAHLALKTITDEYQTHIAYYDKKLREKVLWDQQISAEVHEAIEEMQIRPYLQPIADVNGKVVGAEALARWIHPERGFMPPNTFIPVFEKNGMIVDVDRHMWRCACKILAEWKKAGIDLFISVNISPKDFYFINVVSEIKSLVEEYGVDPSKLRVEITETVMMTDAEDRMRMMDELRKFGFIVEMDDFGSGYSSLNLLKDMPVDVLKIDMKFLSSSGDDKKLMTIIKNIIILSDDLGIASLTEGVETKEQYEQLAEIGCKLFQGYYFSKPLPIDEFNKFASLQNE
ncbi:EAL domain-containing protein [uncultured Ruminococcus sp.]|uniref:EAL domain-containing protein n=1 Tax=uncultured Ruminococcus sp. TaxID=165186 RepID=UPI0025FBCDF3|nr:EAL domain-containing protein [uncultured Ruminococcus sp.]